MSVHREADVAVVGGGFAGLMAARTVARAGFEPVVLEARDRVGGRVVSEPIGHDAVVEMGGQWVAHRDERLRALLGELGIEMFPVYDRGRHLIELGQGVRSYRGSVPRVSPRTLIDVARARLRLDRAAKRVPAAAPWEGKRAAEWDALTASAWFDDNLRTPDGRALLDTAITTIWGEDPHGVNMLAALAFINTAGSFDGLSATRGGLLQDRVVGGSARLSDALAAELGDRVLYDCPVEAVSDRGSSVEVEAGGARVTARRAIVAVPPALALGIRFEPGLPTPHRQALESLPLGSVIKFAAVYERPFWRDNGLSGRSVTAHGPITTTIDNSPPDGVPGVLVGFCPGRRSRELRKLPEAERREAVLGTFTRLFGDEAARPERFVERDWTAEPWTGGCYFGLPGRGVMTSLLPTFGSPFGSIHWAGTETAFGSYGGMDGALSSGERAASEALAAISPAAAAPTAPDRGQPALPA
jgi:monoamine oxidase